MIFFLPRWCYQFFCCVMTPVIISNDRRAWRWNMSRNRLLLCSFACAPIKFDEKLEAERTNSGKQVLVLTKAVLLQGNKGHPPIRITVYHVKEISQNGKLYFQQHFFQLWSSQVFLVSLEHFSVGWLIRCKDFRWNFQEMLRARNNVSVDR